jgi:hypothetical protein
VESTNGQLEIHTPYHYNMQISYHVVFFDNNFNRSWVRVDNVIKFSENKNPNEVYCVILSDLSNVYMANTLCARIYLRSMRELAGSESVP